MEVRVHRNAEYKPLILETRFKATKGIKIKVTELERTEKQGEHTKKVNERLKKKKKEEELEEEEMWTWIIDGIYLKKEQQKEVFKMVESRG